jgi:ligand-binding SRPBCC domain-containing protein
MATGAGLVERLLRADVDAPRNVSRLRRETVVERPIDETFAFFADAANLEALTPEWLNFRILTPQPIAMGEGTEIDYRIVLYGIPIPWKTRIEIWQPGVRFVDRQILGPYRWWNHEHRFEAVPEGTRVIDEVEFVPRVRLLSGPWVQRDVDRIFSYRQQRLRAIRRLDAVHGGDYDLR